MLVNASLRIEVSRRAYAGEHAQRAVLSDDHGGRSQKSVAGEEHVGGEDVSSVVGLIGWKTSECRIC